MSEQREPSAALSAWLRPSLGAAHPLERGTRNTHLWTMPYLTPINWHFYPKIQVSVASAERQSNHCSGRAGIGVILWPSPMQFSQGPSLDAGIEVFCCLQAAAAPEVQ